MQTTNHPLKIQDLNQDCLRITIEGDLTSEVTEHLRNSVKNCLDKEPSVVYIDVKNAIEVDLSGINEVTHSYYVLKNKSKKMILVYKIDSNVDKWVSTSGIDKFIKTAIIPQ